MCLSPKYLSASIKSASGRTATEWIERLVLIDAKSMLASTQDSIWAISEELGFSSEALFSKYFKRLTGQSPLQYRKDARKVSREKGE